MQQRCEILPKRIEGNEFLLRRWPPSDAETVGRAIDERTPDLRPWMAWIALEPLARAHQAASGLEQGLRLQMPEIAEGVVRTAP